MDRYLCLEDKRPQPSQWIKRVRSLIIQNKLGLFGVHETKVKKKNASLIVENILSGWTFTSNITWVVRYSKKI